MPHGRSPVFMTVDQKRNPIDRSELDACGVGFIYRREPLHSNLKDALNALSRVEHRGACSADGISGDGAGIMSAIPRDVLRRDGVHITERDAVGMIFLPQNEDERVRARQTIERVVEAHGFCVKTWRPVPVNHDCLGPLARAACPAIEQVILSPDAGIDNSESELRLFVARQEITDQVDNEEFYIASLSSKSIVYKAMTRSDDLKAFYKDLENENYISRFVVFHRRFSTNTTTKWKLAQPFRMVAHNGEINTIDGNLNWLMARLTANCDRESRQPAHQVKPDWAGSDSSVLDYALETIIRQGDSPEAALMKLIPESHENETYLGEHPEILHFYEYFASLQEPWDGPAMVVFSDGKSLGATLDRNGLRPARYSLYEDGSMLLCSEAGMKLSGNVKVVERGRLGPGEMISVNLENGTISTDRQIKEAVARQFPYGQWLLLKRSALKQQDFQAAPSLSATSLVRMQAESGFGKEDVDSIITAMALTESEPLFSMGDDTPIAVLSKRPKTLFDYFRQRFAQVTNPPIDPIRERVVMSLATNLGIKPKSLVPDNVSAQNLFMPSPILNEAEVDYLLTLDEPLKARRVSTVFDQAEDLETALDNMLERARQAIRDGVSIIILSDRKYDSALLTIPPLMAVGALHHDLIGKGLRLQASIVIETSQCWTSHHFACLLTFGAQAACPYLSYESIRHWYVSETVKEHIQQANHLQEGQISKIKSIEHYRGLSSEQAQQRYRSAIENGLLKIMSKMGISKISSYVGAQIMECIGLCDTVNEKCFTGINSSIGGLTFSEIKEEVINLHAKGQAPNLRLIDEGTLKSRKQGEHHRNNPEMVKALHKAVALKESGADEKTRQKQYEIYSALISGQQPASIRDFLDIKSDREPIAISDVEPVEAILKRFLTGGMSLGALSKEAHETLAVAMNRIGARSNSGEGGEDPLRYKPIKVEADGTSKDFPNLKSLLPGDSAASSIRQVASGRFGVTPEYLVTSEQLEIKIAQGAKPGEGGQLPGHKVSEYIAKLRRTRPGVTLISPPPHHDIYSIEDLAQLIHDLKTINPTASVSVKLVAEKGIGTVACGVVKAGGDIVHISGHDGGTGAAPVSSIKHAGMPWELGLNEAHRNLYRRGLRSRVTLRVDGGLRSGYDVVKAALLGADEFAFGTIALLSQGCIMARVCHTNNCPVGIATQKETLRNRFHGDPASVVNFFTLVAEEVRYLLAALGYQSIKELTGRFDLLSVSSKDAPKTKSLNLEALIKDAVPPFIDLDNRFEHIIATLNHSIVNDPDIIQAVEENGIVMKSYEIGNTDRSIGAALSGLITRAHGDSGFEGQIVLNFNGIAGQSFGAFNAKNVRLTLTGEANDYVGKGMHAGEIIIKQAEEDKNSSSIMAGNTCLYGATGGRLFVEGVAGERFAVRNSAAHAVVEGTGDHTCEYMTGGTIAVLGSVGRNFGAGMTGGIAYVLDEDGDFSGRFESDEDKVIMPLTTSGESQLLKLIEDHYHLTRSQKAEQILNNWEHYRDLFVQVVPLSELDNIVLSADPAIVEPILVKVEGEITVPHTA